MDFNERNLFNQRKLDHYNKWLMDPNREIGAGPYPGFPEEIELMKASQKRAKRIATDVIVQAKATAKVNAAPKAKRVRARKGEGPTKQDLAVEIYKRLAGDKAAVIEAIQAELGMSLAGATTYFYNAKKLA